MGVKSFNSRVIHEIGGKQYVTVVEPMFTRVDLRRFTEGEWNRHLTKKAAVLKGYLEQLNKEGNIVHMILVCEDFKTVSCIIYTLFSENMLPHVYYSSEGALKSAAYNLKESLVRVTSVKAAEKGGKALESVSSQWAYPFF